jgi:hypothetical protein
MKSKFANLALIALQISCVLLPLQAQAAGTSSVLKGGVRLENGTTRLSRPSGNAAPALSTADSIPVAPPRNNTLSGGAQGSGLIDKTAFSALPAGPLTPLNPSSGNAQAQNSRFDIGAERSSKQLTLAWEAWHKQLSSEIYARWQEVALIRGRATMRVTVTRDHHVIAQLTSPSGNRRFDSTLLDVVNSLDGNAGLSFPTGSQRPQVSFEADYIADSNVKGGYSWTKNDYETVQEQQ